MGIGGTRALPRDVHRLRTVAVAAKRVSLWSNR
jgi:hypothetical protein